MLRNENGGGSCLGEGGEMMGKEREWREDFQMEIGWNVGQSRNGWSHHNQTWNLSGHLESNYY